MFLKGKQGTNPYQGTNYELRIQEQQIRTATGGRHAQTPAEYYQSAESAHHTNGLQVLVYEVYE